MKERQWIAILLLALCLLLLLGGCVPHRAPSADAAGFFTGIWHGWIAPVSLVLSFFGDYQLYESHNTGFPYNLGFYMAIISGFGGLALFRGKKKK
ncbi:MAG TPA: hypothetical protein IAD07_02090 [Candidatus Fimivicinus intestinavium]|nr:hypothetical protein [Candidatus Fimivicinus intestinavium]